MTFVIQEEERETIFYFTFLFYCYIQTYAYIEIYTHIYIYLNMYSPALKLAALVGIASAS